MSKQKGNSKPELTEAQKKQVKVDNFARVCPPRMNKALKAIGLVGDCTLPTYTYSVAQYEYVVAKLQAAVDDVKARYEGKTSESGGFVLPK